METGEPQSWQLSDLGVERLQRDRLSSGEFGVGARGFEDWSFGLARLPFSGEGKLVANSARQTGKSGFDDSPVLLVVHPSSIKRNLPLLIL